MPVQESNRTWLSLLNRKNLMTAAATIAVVFIVFWGPNLIIDLPDGGNKDLAAEMLEAEKLMTEVNTLVDNALPPIYLELSGANMPEFNEEFYQFLIPAIEQNNLT